MYGTTQSNLKGIGPNEQQKLLLNFAKNSHHSVIELLAKTKI